MKKFCYWLFLAVMLFATMNSGCGGSGGGDIAIPKTDTQTPTASVIHVEIDDSEVYETKYKAFYGYTLSSGWVLLAESEAGDVSFDIAPQYTALGFEFYVADITDDTVTWGYSDVFFRDSAASEVSDANAQESVSKNVHIALGGTASEPTFEAKVNGTTVSTNNAVTNTRYNWGNAAGHHDTSKYREISVKISNSGAYIIKSQALYGRQPGGQWVNLGNAKNFNVSTVYTEFGYEFDIVWGTDWPYSNVFWNAEKSEQEDVRNIEISTGGTVRWSNITIKVNGSTVFEDSGCSSHSRYAWGL